MKVLLVEPVATGHRMSLYVRMAVRAALARGWHLKLLTSQAYRLHPAMSSIRKEGGRNLSITYGNFPLERGNNLVLNQVKYYLAVRTAFQKLTADFDVVFVPCLDEMDKALVAFGSPFGDTPFVAIQTSVKFHRAKLGLGPPSRSDLLYGAFFKSLLRIAGLRKLLVIDEPFYLNRHKFGICKDHLLALLHDVGEVKIKVEKSAARSEVGVSDSEFMILVYGSISDRKGVSLLLRALSLIDDVKFCVVLAGKTSENMRPFVEKLNADFRFNIRVVKRCFFHGDIDEGLVFSAADFVWLGYVGGSYGSSGVLYQAASTGIPVIATTKGVIGWQNKRYQLGVPIDVSDVSAVASEIHRLCVDQSLRRMLSRNGLECAALHTHRQFGEDICMALRPESSVERW